MLLLAAAAVVAAPAPAGHYTAPIAKRAEYWITAERDWPEGKFQRNTYTAVSFELTVNPRGGVTGCKVTKVVGPSAMGELTCKLLRIRPRFDSARDPSGNPIYGIYRNTLVWWMPPENEQERPPLEDTDYRLAVDQLPPGAEGRSVAYVQFGVDARGQGSDCTPVAERYRVLGEIACDRLGPVFQWEPARDSNGRLVESAQEAKIELVPR